MKTLKELGFDYKGDFYGFELIPFSKQSCLKALSNSEKPSEIARIKEYENSLYKESDREDIQKAINYTVVRWIKMEKTFNNTVDSLKRWKYVDELISSYKKEFPDKNFNVKSFQRMKNELIEELFRIE